VSPCGPFVSSTQRGDREAQSRCYRDLLWECGCGDSNPYWTSVGVFRRGHRPAWRPALKREVGLLPVPAARSAGALAGATLTRRSTGFDDDLAFLQGNDVRVIGRSDTVGPARGFPGSEGNIIK